MLATGPPQFTLTHRFSNNWELIWALALKELRIRYKRSALGFLWALLNPLLMLVILTVVFSTIVRLSVDKYAVFLISALLPWTFFSQTLSYSTESLIGNGELLKKVRVDKTIFPFAAVVSNLINFLLSLVPLALILVVLRFPFHWTWIYLPVPLVGLVLFTAGCSLFCAAANVFFRDVGHIVQIVLTGWFYLSPVIYSLDFIPERYRLLLRLNPMVYILHGFRLAIYNGRLPSAQSAVLSVAVGSLTFALGYYFFRRVQWRLVYYV